MDGWLAGQPDADYMYPSGPAPGSRAHLRGPFASTSIMRQARIHLSSPEKRSSSLFTRSDSPSSTGSYSDVAFALDPKSVFFLLRC